VLRSSGVIGHPSRHDDCERRFRRYAVLLCTPLAACGGSMSEPPAKPVGAASTSVTSPPAPSPVATPHPAAPATPRRPTVSEFHGVKVTDDYAWLQNARDPEVRDWGKAQNAYTRSILDALPDRAAIKARVTELLLSTSVSYSNIVVRKGVVFALKEQPPKEQPFLVVRGSVEAGSSERVVVDPNEIDASGKTTIDFFVPSRDGKLVAVSLSQGGTESGTVHVFDVESGKAKPDQIARVNGGTAGGSLSWNADGSGFFYTRYPAPGERPPADVDFYQQVYFHKLGAPNGSDTYEVGKDFPRIAETTLLTSDDGRYTLASVANGDGGEFAFYLHDPRGSWARLASFSDHIVGAEFGLDDTVYLVSHAAPHGQVLRLAPGAKALGAAQVIVPESDVVIQNIMVTRSRLFVVDLVGGPSQIRVFPLSAAKGRAEIVPILPVSNVSEITRLAEDAVLFRNESYLEPPAWYTYDIKSGRAQKTALAEKTAADMSAAEVTRETCTSKDGTQVPLSIVRNQGAPVDGSNVALLTGYGGFAISRSPKFRPSTAFWLEQRGVFAEANLRGGAEFGEAWHRAGNLLHKQNVFDDFHACAKHLVDGRVTTPERLAILGGSNGGLLMGAQIVQHPEAYRVAVSFVGLYDMLHAEETPNGAFNVTEFGTVKDLEQFGALYAYSPFHNVKDQVPYPAVLFLSGANDPRVDPYNSRKMTARLQAASSSGHPILLRAGGDSGHVGIPLNEEIEQLTDAFSFVLHELGIPFRAVSPPLDDRPRK
jgi:prolyl oligopeptidase